MKKSIILIFAMAFMAQYSIAQDDIREKIVFGLKGGGNYSNVYDAQAEQFNANPKLGFAAGGFLAIPLGVSIGIQPELLYSQRGFFATGVMLAQPYNLTRTSTFIDVPVLFAFKPNGFITFLAGPQYSYLIKQKDEFKNGTASIEQENEFRNENIRKNILCFTGGVDVNLGHLVVSGRAGFDILKNNGDGSTTTPRYKNVWYQATIGYRFFN
jgi:hypothetical protein